MPKVLVDWWYYESCPLTSDCSVQSFKRAKCSGKCPAQAKLALKHHLVNSANHLLDPEDADRVIRGADLKNERYYETVKSDETQGDEKEDKVEDDKKTVQVEDEKKKVKVEESSPVTLCPNNKRKLDDSIQVRVEESDDEEKSSSVVLCENKKRKLDDSDLDKLLFEAANKVQKGLECVAVAQQNMEEAKDALRKIQAVVDRISKSRGPPDVD